ncbi:MAG TPA: tRNA (adenosine(37)-N6)-dimethylallyltransferase MiaA [Bacilli bacterium]|nr:tRNA (adenosine(37)-N6)-dimethylallyltransferase MiaA [Bacilli bacterium]
MTNIYVVVGPTGVGKTTLSLALAKHFDAEVINADSMQIYKELNIGTAKITKGEMKKIPHHLLSIKSVKDSYSVYEYQKDCREEMGKISKKKKNIVIVGGTGLYIKAALYNYIFQEEKKKNYDDLTDKEVIEEIKKYGNLPNIDLKNRRRLCRYLEKLENNTFSDIKKNERMYDFKIIGLTANRDDLYKRIDLRVDKMIEEGLLVEVKKLYDDKIDTIPIRTAIGYKELYDFYDEKIDYQKAIELIKRNSRRYAKRQYTFFKNQFDDIKWFDVNYYNFDNTCKEVINYLKGE